MSNWRYKLEDDFYAHHPLLEGVSFENKWISIKSSLILIRSSYAWDGCTPSYCLFPGAILPKGLWLGVWDGPLGDDCRPATWMATLVHDALCQFREEITGLSKDVTVDLFQHLLARNNAPKWMQVIYPVFVSKFGPQEWK